MLARLITLLLLVSAPGQAANIIATASNPLDDIQALRRVVLVMKDGKVIKR